VVGETGDCITFDVDLRGKWAMSWAERKQWRRISKAGIRLTSREQFLAVMDHAPADRAPSWELGIWPQTQDRWLSEGMPDHKRLGDWFSGVDTGRENTVGLDVREFVPVHMGMSPPFERRVFETTDRYEVVRDGAGIVRKALLY
jgi:hypothetical protein